MSGLKLGIKFLKPETRCRKGFLGLKWCRGLNPMLSSPCYFEAFQSTGGRGGGADSTPLPSITFLVLIRP